MCSLMIIILILSYSLVSGVPIKSSVCNVTYDVEDPQTIQIAMLDVIRCQSQHNDENFKVLLAMLNQTLNNQQLHKSESWLDYILNSIIVILGFSIFVFLLKQLMQYILYRSVMESDRIGELYLIYRRLSLQWFRTDRSPRNLEELRSDMAPPLICRCCKRPMEV